jgi:mannosyltransferase
MILFDGIVYLLQQYGGISTLFREIVTRMPIHSYVLLGFHQEPPPAVTTKNYFFQSPRPFERYRRALTSHELDIFHSTYYRLPEAINAKIVTTVYDYTYEHFNSGIRRFVHSYQKNKAIAGSDIVICISESTRRDLLEFSGHVYDDRTVVIYIGASSDYCYIPEIEVAPQVIYVGARGGYKNFKSVVYALSILKDINLVCIGGGPFTEDEVFILNKHVHGRYRHKGYLTNAELNHEYNQSLCLIYPSLYEGFGIPILEAMQAGCPVVAVNISSIPEVAGDASILMEAGHPDEIIQAINTILISQNRNELVHKGLSQSLKFTWDKTFKQTLNVYENLLGKRISE